MGDPETVLEVVVYAWVLVCGWIGGFTIGRWVGNWVFKKQEQRRIRKEGF